MKIKSHTKLSLFVQYISKVDQFFAYVNIMSKMYRSNNVLITMGEDFNYQDANMWYKNMDKLIKYTILSYFLPSMIDWTAISLQVCEWAPTKQLRHQSLLLNSIMLLESTIRFRDNMARKVRRFLPILLRSTRLLDRIFHVTSNHQTLRTHWKSFLASL